MENILEDKQRSQIEKAQLLINAYYKGDKDIILHFHYFSSKLDVLLDDKEND